MQAKFGVYLSHMMNTKGDGRNQMHSHQQEHLQNSLLHLGRAFKRQDMMIIPLQRATFLFQIINTGPLPRYEFSGEFPAIFSSGLTLTFSGNSGKSGLAARKSWNLPAFAFSHTAPYRQFQEKCSDSGGWLKAALACDHFSLCFGKTMCWKHGRCF